MREGGHFRTPASEQGLGPASVSVSSLEVMSVTLRNVKFTMDTTSRATPSNAAAYYKTAAIANKPTESDLGGYCQGALLASVFSPGVGEHLWQEGCRKQTGGLPLKVVVGGEAGRAVNSLARKAVCQKPRRASWEPRQPALQAGRLGALPVPL